MSAPPAPRSRRSAALRIVVAALLGLGLAGCTVATSASGSTAAGTASPSTPVAAAARGATVVVTVPQLATVSSSAQSGPPSSSSVSAPTTSKTAPSTRTSTAASSTRTSTAVRTPKPVSTAAPTSPTVPTASSTPAAPTLSVKPANCPACTVLGTHAGVTSTLGAALVATGSGRAVLLALRTDGSVAGVGNVVYGTTFPTQAGGQLACDSSGRCIVIAQQSDGTAIASAYQVSARGVWSEVTGQPGIASVTAKAETLSVGGGVGVAVQDEADGSTVWIVYSWQGDGYGVKGCTAAATPDPDALTMDACLS